MKAVFGLEFFQHGDANVNILTDYARLLYGINHVLIPNICPSFCKYQQGCKLFAFWSARLYNVLEKKDSKKDNKESTLHSSPLLSSPLLS